MCFKHLRLPQSPTYVHSVVMLQSVRNDPSKVTNNRGVWYPLIEKSAGRS